MIAILYGFLDEIIYVGQTHIFLLNPELVYCLQKALYKWKKVSQVWYKSLLDFLKKLGSECLKLDYGVFVSQDRPFFRTIYVDNVLIFASDDLRLKDIQDKLSARFNTTNLGQVSHYLDMEVDVEVAKQISPWQTAYLKKILGRFQMTDFKLVCSPMNPGLAKSVLQSDQ